MKGIAKAILRPRVLWPTSILLLLAGIVMLLSIQPRFMIRELAEQNPEVLFFVETQRKAIALTIDDAPSNILTPTILEILEENEIPVTFFIIGDHALGKEALITRMKSAGHELGNHMVHDEASIQLSEAEFKQNLLAVEELIGPLGIYKWCRPGSGWFSPEMVKIAHGLGYRCCLGSIYPFDNKIRNSDLILQTVKANIKPGDILVLHEGNNDREYIIPLLRKLIPALKAEGYDFLTVSQLVALEINQP